jgi:multiple PDZ domain protein
MFIVCMCVYQVAQLSKFKEGGGLGISLEGTVDVENGVEVRPHHYIRAILPDGPVGVNGRLHSGDELLEVRWSLSDLYQLVYHCSLTRLYKD